MGRGLEPLSTFIDIGSPLSSGNATTTYSAVPHMLTSSNQSFALENSEYAVFDMRDPDATVVEVRFDWLNGCVRVRWCRHRL